MNFFVFLFVVFMFAYVVPRMGRRRDAQEPPFDAAREREFSHLRDRVATLERVLLDRDTSLRRDIDRLG